MDSLQLTLAVGAICLMLSAYIFGLSCGRNEERRKGKTRTLGLRASLSAQNGKAFKLAQSNDQLYADNALLRATHTQPLSAADRYTIAQASYELAVAARTFNSLNSTTHAQKAANLSKACLDLSQRLDSTPKTASLAPEEGEQVAPSDASTTTTEAAA